MISYRRFKLIMGMIILWIAFVIGVILLINTKVKCASYVKTEAVIVSVGVPGNKDLVTYSYIVDGKTVQGSNNEVFGANKHVGDRATVRYDPDKPTTLENRSETKFLLISTPILGILATLYTAFMIRRRR